MTTSATTEQFDECMKKQVQVTEQLLRVLKSYKEDNIPHKIDEGLYLGSIASAFNKLHLKNHNITHILTVASRIKPPHPADFVYKLINVVDKNHEDLKQHFNECFDFIDEAKRLGGGVLVHCFAGKSRSVTVVIAYLMKTRGMSFNEAWQHVRTIRPAALPNAGFILQLMDFEMSLQEQQESGRDRQE
ncbi:dual specificity protein phosphatase 1 isoform X2 [Cajanus cajan]|uniref:dual specificity protein phosphatase 1 isoform X2 n=1 Tax=Cajanus cajan TaxID=3821 RepID=UPI00098DAAE3|nr:dual specificity protein phosphatase 1 isoform X2 [Cajanus cajan]